MIKYFILGAGLVLAPLTAHCWDGTDASSGEAVEIGKGNLVRSGRDIEIYDHGAGEYRDVTVESIQRSGSSVEVEVYDQESGEFRTLEMED
jgi:hypothetical protein